MGLEIQQYLDWLVNAFAVGAGLYFIFAVKKNSSKIKDNSKVEISGSPQGCININFIKNTIGVLALMLGSVGVWQMMMNPYQSFAKPAGHEGAPPIYKGAGVEPIPVAPEFTKFLNKGLVFELEKQPDLAFESYRQALTQRAAPLGEAAQALSRMAQIRLDQGYPDEAILLARIAVDLEGENSLYRRTLARILIRQCRLYEAEAELDQIADDNSATKELRQALGGIDQENCAKS